MNTNAFFRAKAVRVLLIWGMTGLFGGAIQPGPAIAQLSLQPELLVLDFQADQELIREVQITNKGIHSKEVWVDAEYRWQGPGPEKIEDWVEITPAHFRLPGKMSLNMRLRFRKSAVALKGESHFFIFVREELSQPVRLNIKTGIPVFVRINHGVDPQGEISKFLKKRMDTGAWNFEVQVKNISGMYLLPFGFSSLNDPSGNRIEFQEVRLRQPIPPGQTKSLTWQLPPEVAVKGGKVNLELFWGTLYGMDQGKARSKKTSTVITW